MIITPQEYNEFIGYEGSKLEPRLPQIIKAVSGVISKYLGYTIEPDGTKSESIRLTSGRTVYYLDGLDVDNVTSSSYYQRSTDTSTDLLDYKNIIISGARVELMLDWPIADNDILFIEYSLPTDIAEDIKLAALMLTRYYVKDEYIAQGMSAAGSSITYITGKNLPPHVRTILDLHRVL